MKSMKRIAREARLRWLANLSITVENANKGGVPAQEILMAVMNGLGLNGTAEGETDAEA